MALQVTIKLFGVLRQKNFKEKQCDLPEGSTVADVIGMLLLSEQLIGAVVINGRHAVTEDLLKNGDELIILPLMDGG